MNRVLLSLAALSILAVGCAQAAPVDTTPARAAVATAKSAEGGPGATMEAAPLPKNARMPGDFVVFRVSAKGTTTTLTQRVIARTGDMITVDVTVDDGAAKTMLRVRFSDAEKTRNEILSVARLQGEQELPTTHDAYESLVAGLAADANEGALGSEDVKVPVGKDTLDAKRTSFRVRVGKKSATLRTLESPAFAWGDLGGEITTDGGKVLYKAEVVDAGRDQAPSSAAPALAIDE